MVLEDRNIVSTIFNVNFECFSQIMFEASVGSSYSGDIAIDDVLITDGACPMPGKRRTYINFL